MRNGPSKYVVFWLLSGCGLIFLMVIVGGITRLTHSGLSMVNWNLVMGAVPPLNEKEWVDAFNQYKRFPEYQQVNFMFTLNDFKRIFFWEYLHRLLGRLIGVVFLLPFIYFIIKKRLSRNMILKCFFLFFLGGLQGVVGWWMVKSGLVNNPDVSHYRLSVHLIMAFLTFAYTLWLALELIFLEREKTTQPLIKKGLILLFLVTVLQIVYGAFVAGLNAGFTMNTWPLMGDTWIAESVTAMVPFWVNFVEGIGGVQFVHRYLAYLVVLVTAFLLYCILKLEVTKPQKVAIIILFFVVLMQFLLGVFTLVYAVPLVLGVAHQVGAFLFLGTIVYALNRFRGEIE